MKVSDLQGEIKVISSPSGASPTMTPQNQSAYSKLSTNLSDASAGAVKGVLSTARGLGTIGQGILNSTVGKLVGQGGSDVYRKNTVIGQKVSDFLAPKNTAEKVGFGIEQAAEYLIPAFKTAKAERYINILSQSIKSGLGAATFRVATKSAVQGAAAGAVKLAQTGGDTKEAGKTALLAGGIRAATGVVGEVARAFRLPEKLYTTLFKNAKDDMLSEFNAEGLNKLKATKPDVYAELVNAGVIKEVKTGAPFLNNTMAEEALNRGLKGSIRNIANEMVGKKYETEYAVQQVVKNYKGTVSLKEPQFEKVLRQISQEYEDVGFNEISDQATSLADDIKLTGGNVTGETMLNVRRLLDRARKVASFDKPVTKLSLTEANLKTLADVARNRLNEIPGMGKLMKDYSFYIEGLLDLSKEAARRGNNQVVSLIDSLFLGGALTQPSVIPLSLAAVGRRLLYAAPGATGLGQMLNNSVLNPVQSALGGEAASVISPNLGDGSPPKE